MNQLKDIRVLAIVILAVTGMAIEGLRQLQLSKNPMSEELGRAGEIFSMHKDSTLNTQNRSIETKQVGRPSRMAPMAHTRGVKFDLKDAVSKYQKEHGLDHDFGADKGKKAEADKKDKKKKKSEYEYVYNPKTGQWEKRKKLTDAQKKMLAERRKKQEEQKALVDAQHAKDKKSSDSNFQGVPMEQAAGVTPANPEAEKESAFLTYEEWAQRLLQHPNNAELQKFIEAYRSQKVTSDVYSRILEAMLTDPRIEMVEQGLTLANYTPGTAAFTALVQFLDDQSIANSSRALAEKHLERYASIQHLGLLEKLMKMSSETQVIVAATQKLKSAIHKYLDASAPSVDPTTSSAGNAYVSNFSKFVQVLNGLIQSQNAEVVSQARITLEKLQNSLSRYNIAANE